MKRELIIGIFVVITLALCGCALLTWFVGVDLFLQRAEIRTNDPVLEVLEPSVTPVVVRPLPVHANMREKMDETLSSLMAIELPTSDLRELAQRLEGKENIPITVEPGEFPLNIGSKKVFWVSNVDTNFNHQINTTLQYVTDHVYFWIQDDLPFDPDALKALVETFENEIYPTNRKFFGSEWSPGVDGDPHLYIIFADGLGGSLAGYFSSADEHHPLAHEYSNAHESFVLNADNVSLDSEFAYAVLAHEFQHMIHWYRDRNEASWVNEGFSELAVFLNDYDVGSEYSYIVNPDIQLNDWPKNHQQTLPHYGAAFLFFTYFLDRFGEQITSEIVGEPLNGLNGIDAVLEKNNILDPLTGDAISAEDVFSDWVISSFLQDKDIADGRYYYHNYSEAPKAEATETIYDCPSEMQTREVSQFGVDYIRINCEGKYTVRFEGSSQVEVIPVSPYSGDYYFWSNKGDEADSTLTKTFDFSDYDGPLSLTFYTWYDLEEDYDYVYLEVSEDGETWQILETTSGTIEDPSGNSYGWGFNGITEGWIQEKIDLSDYSGKEIQLRFEYVTDAAVHGEGMVIDEIAIPEIGYSTGFEEGEDGWKGEGWLRMNNILPQTYRVSLVEFGEHIEILPIPLGDDLSAEISIAIGDDIDHVVLVISGTTRFSRQKAPYRFQIQ